MTFCVKYPVCNTLTFLSNLSVIQTWYIEYETYSLHNGQIHFGTDNVHLTPHVISVKTQYL